MMGMDTKKGDMFKKRHMARSFRALLEFQIGKRFMKLKQEN